MSLAHSEDITGRLLEAVVDAASPLRLVEIEGDAAFFYLPHEPAEEASATRATAGLALAMLRAFHARQQARMSLFGGTATVTSAPTL